MDLIIAVTVETTRLKNTEVGREVETGESLGSRTRWKPRLPSPSFLGLLATEAGPEGQDPSRGAAPQEKTKKCVQPGYSMA